MPPGDSATDARSYTRVIAYIEDALLSGRLASGDRLPSERELSEIVGVSRASTREALRILEALEVVRVLARNGRGSGSVLAEQSGGALRDLLRLSLALGHFTVSDVIDARIAIETWAVRQVTEHRTERDLAVLSGILEEMAVHRRDPAALIALDADYHIAIARMSRSSLVGQLMEGMRSAIRQWMTTGAGQVLDVRVASSRVRDEHIEIYNCIKRGDGDAAASVIERHIRGFYENVQAAEPHKVENLNTRDGS